MKLRLSNSPSRQQGSVLGIALMTAGIIGVVLLSYLDLASTQQRSVYRSQNWNSILPVCEAGIEEAMAHLNNVGNEDRGTNGWVLRNNEYYMIRTPFMDTNSWYEVSISQASPPVITSSGYVFIPLTRTTLQRNVRVTTTRRSTGIKGMVGKDNISLGAGSVVNSFHSGVNPVYSDLIANSNAFVGAVGGSITGGTAINGDAATGPGGTITTTVTGSTYNDLNVSFPDVTAPTNTPWNAIPQNVLVVTTNYFTATNTYSTNVYPSPAPTGTVATNHITATSTNIPATNVAYSSSYSNATTTSWPGASFTITTNTTYLTNQTTTPLAGTYLNPPGIYSTNSTYTNYTISQIGNSGNYRTNETVVNNGTVSAYYRIDSYTYQVTNYTTTNTSYYISENITNQTYGTNTYDYALGTGNYYSTTEVRMTGGEMLVYGDAVLWLKGGIRMSGNAQISVMAGGSLTVYVGDTTGSDVSGDFSGNGVVNMNGSADKLTVYGFPNNTSLTFGGNAGLTGTIYAPSAELVGNGGGRDSYDMVGAVIVKDVNFNGHVKFHYDEKLGDNNAVTQWNIGSWTEF